MSSQTRHLEPPSAVPRLLQYTASGEPELEVEESDEAGHLRVLRGLPMRALLAEVDSELDVDTADGSVSEASGPSIASTSPAMSAAAAAAASARASAMPVVLGRLGAAHREADQLVRLLGLLRGSKHLQSAPRDVQPAAPPPALLGDITALKRRQLETAAAALERGAQELRSRGQRASRVHADARALRAHWKLLELDSPSATSLPDAARRYALRLELSALEAAGGALGTTPAAAPSTLGGASAAIEATGLSSSLSRVVILTSDEHGTMHLPSALGLHADVLRVDCGRPRPHVAPPFLEAPSAGAVTAAGVAREEDGADALSTDEHEPAEEAMMMEVDEASALPRAKAGEEQAGDESVVSESVGRSVGRSVGQSIRRSISQSSLLVSGSRCATSLGAHLLLVSCGITRCICRTPVTLPYTP